MPKQPKEKIIHTTISDEVHRVVRRYRVDDGLTVRQIVEQAILAYGGANPTEATADADSEEVELDV